jgi:hypothetical protein
MGIPTDQAPLGYRALLRESWQVARPQMPGYERRHPRLGSRRPSYAMWTMIEDKAYIARSVHLDRPKLGDAPSAHIGGYACVDVASRHSEAGCPVGLLGVRGQPLRQRGAPTSASACSAADLRTIAAGGGKGHTGRRGQGVSSRAFGAGRVARSGGSEELTSEAARCSGFRFFPDPS